MARRLVSLAVRAPSVHNSQPWAWRIGPDSIELYADQSRRLDAADPTGRDLVISCGTALHHLQVAARASGLLPQVDRLPDAADPEMLARVRFSTAPISPTASADLRAIQERCTDRRRFTSWAVPDERLNALVRVVDDDGGHAVAVTDVTDRFRVDLLVARAHRLQERDAEIVEEVRQWTDRNAYDGLPSDHLPGRPVVPDKLPSRFDEGLLPDTGQDVEISDGVILLYDADDSRASWLRAGESLSALWLSAVRDGLSVVPLSQVIEVPETRDALQHQVLGDLAVPLLLARVGWLPISRSQLAPTPRRPLDDVLLG
jgi:nitroreductase